MLVSMDAIATVDFKILIVLFQRCHYSIVQILIPSNVWMEIASLFHIMEQFLDGLALQVTTTQAMDAIACVEFKILIAIMVMMKSLDASIRLLFVSSELANLVMVFLILGLALLVFIITTTDVIVTVEHLILIAIDRINISMDAQVKTSLALMDIAELKCGLAILITLIPEMDVIVIADLQIPIVYPQWFLFGDAQMEIITLALMEFAITVKEDLFHHNGPAIFNSIMQMMDAIAIVEFQILIALT